jgi:hypothetical protein
VHALKGLALPRARVTRASSPWRAHVTKDVDCVPRLRQRQSFLEHAVVTEAKTVHPPPLVKSNNSNKQYNRKATIALTSLPIKHRLAVRMVNSDNASNKLTSPASPHLSKYCSASKMTFGMYVRSCAAFNDADTNFICCTRSLSGASYTCASSARGQDRSNKYEYEHKNLG